MDIRWLIFAVLFFIIEILTPGIFLFSCFSIGAIMAFFSSYFTKSVILQSVVFCVFSVISIYLLRPLLFKFFTPKWHKTNVNSIIGKIGIVEEDINNKKIMGLVKVENELWRAVCECDEIIPKGSKVEVIKVEGVHIVVKKV
ncbi:MAG: NfeD family protein [Elusimicrobiota bacterium]|nr:NfeD family protein [Endomicrobiia bacterium]MDW8166156.1 NfeD family protein [Elusimicrobiota bacterium]